MIFTITSARPTLYNLKTTCANNLRRIVKILSLKAIFLLRHYHVLTTVNSSEYSPTTVVLLYQLQEHRGL